MVQFAKRFNIKRQEVFVPQRGWWGFSAKAARRPGFAEASGHLWISRSITEKHHTSSRGKTRPRRSDAPPGETERGAGCPPPAAPPAKMAAPDPRASSSGRGCHGAAPPRPTLPPPAGVCLHRAGGAGDPAPGETGTQPTATAARPPSLPGGAPGDAA